MSIKGAYLISCGPRGALLFMAWLGIKVLPQLESISVDGKTKVINIKICDKISCCFSGFFLRIAKYLYFLQVQHGSLQSPNSPLLRHVDNPEGQLEILLDGFEKFEEKIHYRFKDRSYLLQALTHASYTPNQLTDCYQRLEFLGDAVLGKF